MRGKHKIRGADSNQVRNIPAYAGKTIIDLDSGMAWTEHPRVCGENGVRNGARRLIAGTSPRMRGKRRLGRLGPLLWRNIPAYAGKTSITEDHGGPHQEHPRVCGENYVARYDPDIAQGTSPRMRGKPPPPPSPRRCWPEHPRVCGENLGDLVRGGVDLGTSPRMRGKLTGLINKYGPERNIPAYAGKTTTLRLAAPAR